MKSKICIAILIFLFGIVGCHRTNLESPEEIAREYHNCGYDLNWSEMANLLHPSSLSNFREDILSVASTVDSNLKSSEIFDTIRVVKSYQVDRLIKFLRNETTSKLSDKEFFISFCQMVFPYLPINAAKPDTIIIIGSLEEGPDTVHVLSRIKITKRDVPLNGILRLSLVRFQNTWKVLLPDELENNLKLQLSIRKSKFF